MRSLIKQITAFIRKCFGVNHAHAAGHTRLNPFNPSGHVLRHAATRSHQLVGSATRPPAMFTHALFSGLCRSHKHVSPLTTMLPADTQPGIKDGARPRSSSWKSLGRQPSGSVAPQGEQLGAYQSSNRLSFGLLKGLQHFHISILHPGLQRSSLAPTKLQVSRKQHLYLGTRVSRRTSCEATLRVWNLVTWKQAEHPAKSRLSFETF